MDAWSLRCFPSDDDDLCRAATEALAAAETAIRLSSDHVAGDVAVELTTTLRERFPGVVVTPMNALARTGDERVWYVFRDGRPLTRQVAS